MIYANAQPYRKVPKKQPNGCFICCAPDHSAGKCTMASTPLDNLTLVEDFVTHFGGSFVAVVPQAGQPATIQASTATDDPGINANTSNVTKACCEAKWEAKKNLSQPPREHIMTSAQTSWMP